MENVEKDISATAGSTKPATVSQQKKKRKSVLIVLALIFVLIGIAWGVYGFLVLRHFQETHDAYVAGNQVQVMAQVSGSVNKVWFEDTDLVKKGNVLVSLDKTDAEQTFEKAQTALATSVRQTHQLMINGKQYDQHYAAADRQSDRPQPPACQTLCVPWPDR